MSRFPLSKETFKKYLKTSKVKYRDGNSTSRGKCPIEHAIIATVPREKITANATGRRKVTVQAATSYVLIGEQMFYKSGTVDRYEHRLPSWVPKFIDKWDRRDKYDSNNPADYLN